MIHYKDLMIGNWIYESDNGFPMYVVSIGDDYCYLNFDGNEGDLWEGEDKDMMPIEVTEELLVKIGFEKYSHDTPPTEFRKKIGDYYVFVKHTKDHWYFRVYGKVYYNSGGFDFQYLHELQNGIRLITKGDLEVCL